MLIERFLSSEASSVRKEVVGGKTVTRPGPTVSDAARIALRKLDDARSDLLNWAMPGGGVLALAGLLATAVIWHRRRRGAEDVHRAA